MNLTSSNLVDGKLRRAAMVILPMLLLPVSLAGVTIRPMLAFREASVLTESAERRALETGVLRRKLDEHGSVDELEYRAVLLERVLDVLIPVELQGLEVYSVVRSAASASGFELESLTVGEPSVFHDSTRGRCIGRREIRTRAKGSAAQAVQFVDRLRASGLPVAVQSFTFSRRKGVSTYSVKLQFDVFHYIPVAEPSDDGPDSMGPKETIPQ